MRHVYARRPGQATLVGVNASAIPADPYAAADAAAARLRELTGAETHDVALVMGSGWAASMDMIASRPFSWITRSSWRNGSGFTPHSFAAR